jgi:hypothetical protein
MPLEPVARHQGSTAGTRPYVLVTQWTMGEMMALVREAGN